MMRRPPRSTPLYSSAASDVYKRQLQHRGQESAGIATSDDGHVVTLRDTGLVSQVFNEDKLRGLIGEMAIGHVRYSTTGSSGWENTQPVYRSDTHTIALAH